MANEEMVAAWDGVEGDHWADNAARYEATSAAFNRVLMDALPLAPDTAVLDVGCGAGATTLDVARQVPAGSALGVDLSSRMLALARRRAEAAGLHHVRFEQVDAQEHPFQAASFDLAISKFGVMFFADPVAAFANIRRALREGGSIAFLAWRDLDRNEWVSAVRGALAAGRDLPAPLPGVPGPFSLADRSITIEHFRAAGYADVELTSVDEPISFGRDLDDAYAFVSTQGITRGLTADLDEPAKEAAFAELRRSLEAHEMPDGVRFGASAWLITART